MIWVKRAVPFVVIALGWLLYKQITGHLEQAHIQEESTYALATAQAWVASAHFRADTAGFGVWRDSMLAADSLSAETFETYAHRYEKEPEKYQEFFKRVSVYVDSLVSLDLELLRSDKTPRVLIVDSTSVD